MREYKEAGRKGKDPFLPYLSHFLHILASVHLGIVKHDECVLPYCKGELVKEISDAFGCHAFRGTEAMIPAVVVNHSQILSLAPLSDGMVMLSPGNCQPYGTYPSVQVKLRLEIEANKTFPVLLFKLLQLLLLIIVELRRGCPFGRFSLYVQILRQG